MGTPPVAAQWRVAAAPCRRGSGVSRVPPCSARWAAPTAPGARGWGGPFVSRGGEGLTEPREALEGQLVAGRLWGARSLHQAHGCPAAAPKSLCTRHRLPHRCPSVTAHTAYTAPDCPRVTAYTAYTAPQLSQSHSTHCTIAAPMSLHPPPHSSPQPLSPSPKMETQHTQQGSAWGHILPLPCLEACGSASSCGHDLGGLRDTSLASGGGSRVAGEALAPTTNRASWGGQR